MASREVLRLFGSFFKIGCFTFGGGYAMIPLIEREVIDRRRWIDRREFLDLLTLAQSAPGPISLNTSVFVGYKTAGYGGAVAALTGIVVPPFMIILLIAMFFAGMRDNPVVEAAFKGMRPAVVALIVVPVISLARGMHWSMIAVVALSAVAVWRFGVSPVYLIIAAAAAGIAWEMSIAKRSVKR